jgi:ABC-type glutathione transport system ATPase component
MVTHDLRMVQYADRVIQMQDGVVQRVIEDRAEILALAQAGKQEGASVAQPQLQVPTEMRRNGQNAAQALLKVGQLAGSVV